MRKKKLSEWQAVIEEWESSGLTQSEFCRQRSLNKNAFGYWLRRARKAGETAVAFVKVGDSLACAPIELRLSNGAELRIPKSFDAASLKALLEVLQ